MDTVTIPWHLPVNADTEPPLSAYLRSYAEQTGFTILGLWPDPEEPAQAPTAARLYRRRLSSSILHRPLAEALNTLCRIYRTQWVLDGHVIRFWSTVPIVTAQKTPDDGRTAASVNSAIAR